MQLALWRLEELEDPRVETMHTHIERRSREVTLRHIWGVGGLDAKISIPPVPTHCMIGWWTIYHLRSTALRLFEPTSTSPPS